MRLTTSLFALAFATVPFAQPATALDKAVIARNGMVVAGHPLAVASGIRALQAGGTACDAAVATSATLSVMMPDMMGPAGSGFALLWNESKKDLTAIDFNGVAPKATKAADYSLEKKRRGMWAPTVPGNLLGWESIHRKCGKLPWASLWQDAINHAQNGRPMDHDSSFHVRRHVSELGIYDSWAKEFLTDGQAPAPGALHVRRDLAASYRLFAQLGSRALYNGSVGDKLVQFMKKEGGLITKEDLAAYKVIWRQPIESTYRGNTIYGMPPPSAALTWMQILAILEGYDLKALKHNSTEYLTTFVEATKHAYMDSYRHVTDPAFANIPIGQLLSKNYAADIRGRISSGRYDMKTVTQATLNLPSQSATSHMSIIDRWGNAVSMTNTLGNFWGAGIVAEGTGLLLSNGMDWFDVDLNVWTGEKPGSLGMAPGKRNRWTLAPGLIFKNEKLYMVVGGAGAESTMFGIAQPIVNIIDFDMEPFAAVSAPRFLWGDTYHYTGGTEVHLQPGIEGSVREQMKAAGYNVPEVGKQRNLATGTTNLIVIDPKFGTYVGGAARQGRDFMAGY